MWNEVKSLDTQTAIRSRDYRIAFEPASGPNLSGFDFVHIAPDPGLSRLNGADQRMLHFVEMLGRVLVLGRVATADVPAGETQAQMNPGIARLNTLFAHMLVRRSDFDLVQVL